MLDSAFCSGHVLMMNGLVLIVGGDEVYADAARNYPDGRFAVRVFTPGRNPNLQIIGQMTPGPLYPQPITADSGGRWYPSMTTLPDGRVHFCAGVTVSGEPPPALHLEGGTCSRYPTA